ncbi:molybdopterin cofactor-binding domain-containing protein [Marinicella sp. W31]|uniref:molybdopterin cofactor-binding domain-containing protein n=1 Tax=Marinicella sp. W31 TaxID=3023713 RepID=UPI003757EF20
MKLTRRHFLRTSALAGGGLAVSFYLPAKAMAAQDNMNPAMPNAFIRIYPDNRITFISPNIEMGQGIHTSHVMILAEEMGASPNQFKVEGAPVDPKYVNPFFGMMGTGGSTSTPAFWMPLRQAGASAKAMLIAAAAQRWGVKPEAMSVDDGTINHAASGRSLTFGEVASAAAQMTPPEDVVLKAPQDFKLIGQPVKRVEGPEKVTGEAEFGIDVDLPNMHIATLARPLVMGAKVKSIDNKDAVMAMPGVKKVKSITGGVAVIADTYWHAKKASEALKISWDKGSNAKLNTAELFTRFTELSRQPGLTAEKVGEGDALIKDAKEVVKATFSMPYLAHASMEPLNATAWVKKDSAEVWAGTYLQMNDQRLVAEYLKLPPAQVKIHTLLAGGAFGRRAVASADFIMNAVETARGEGYPVKVIWSREHDTRGGYYRPLNVNRVDAVLNKNGMPESWRHRAVNQSIIASTPFAVFLMKEGIDETSVEGATKIPYAIPNRQVEVHAPEVDVPVLWWRSVGHTYTGFVVEHFLDVLARKAGKDALEYRRQLLKENEDKRYLGVLNLAAEKADWGKPLPAGRARGIAVHKSFSSYVCQIAECSIDSSGMPQVHRVTSAVDIGIAVNPWNVEQQVQGAIIYGLTAALYGKIDINDGVVSQSNFHDYRVLRMNEVPEMDVHIVASEESPTGIGEPGVPPIAPAVANAVLALTGKTTERLPFSDHPIT